MFSMYQEEVMKSYVVNNARTIVIHSRQLSAKLCVSVTWVKISYSHTVLNESNLNWVQFVKCGSSKLLIIVTLNK